jgi:hypothetical protein
MRIASGKPAFIKLTVIAAVVAAVFGFQSFSFKFQKVSASAQGPSATFTGAPGEANCTACHFDFPANSGTGGVTITGVPQNYTPNQSFQITVTTSQADAVVYGFEMTAVDALGREAGTFTMPPQTPPQMQIIDGIVDGNARKYIEHTADGIIPTQFGSKSWTFLWTAPAQRVGRVGFYAAGNAANSDATSSGDHIYTASKFTLLRSTVADFDGDNKTDLSIFRPSAGEWWYLKSSNGANAALQFGQSTDKLTPRDFTGDGKTDIAFWRPSTGFWFVLRSEDNSFFSFPFGATGDIPAPADYDADGKTDAAVYRPSTNTWFVSQSTGGTLIQAFGQAGDVPAVADYDGDGKADIAIYRPASGEWWINRTTAGLIAFQFGNSSDKPAVGDYTGDGKADVAFFRPSTNDWFVLRSENNSFFSFPFGAAGDIPTPGDYDGDGKFDAAVFRPSSSTWFAQRSTGAGTLIQGFGIAGDIPVPSKNPAE